LLGSLGINAASFGGLGNAIRKGFGLASGMAVAGTGAGGGPGLGQIRGVDGKIYSDPTYGAGATGPQPVNEAAPAEALNPDGTYGINAANPNSTWTQDQSGSWYNTAPTDTGSTPVDTGSAVSDTGFSDWWA
jgi:hypothetical protein